MKDDAAQTDWEYRIQVIKQKLERHLDEEISLEDLAELAHASPFHFHRVFRGMTGETVRGYVRRLRLERAARQLQRGAEDILGLALSSGYQSHEAFTRAFKEEFGATPSEYRARPAPAVSLRQRAAQEAGIEIRHLGCQRLAYVRHTGTYADVAVAWEALMRWGWTRMLFAKPKTFGLCFDDPDVTEGHRLRYEACMEIGRHAKPKGKVNLRDLEGGSYAVTTHHGPFDQLGSAYARLCAAVVGRELEGRRWKLAEPPSREVYLDDPRATPSAEMRTEIWMPVQAV